MRNKKTIPYVLVAGTLKVGNPDTTFWNVCILVILLRLPLLALRIFAYC